MAGFPLTDTLRAEYERLFNACAMRPTRNSIVEGLVQRLAGNRARYETVGTRMGIPWHFIAVFHNMESGQNFNRHLHNGDPLTARTVQVPAGRPPSSTPPFAWEGSAADALYMRGLGPGTDWSLSGTLYQLEAYNSFGYRRFHPEVLSPYLWSFSSHYSSGKYIADGAWSETATSSQCGAAVLLRRMAERNMIAFADQPLPNDSAAPMVTRYMTGKPSNTKEANRVIALQSWLSTHSGIFLKPDGIAGRNTSDAYRLVTGHYLPGDPRAA